MHNIDPIYDEQVPAQSSPAEILALTTIVRHLLRHHFHNHPEPEMLGEQMRSELVIDLVGVADDAVVDEAEHIAVDLIDAAQEAVLGRRANRVRG